MAQNKSAKDQEMAARMKKEGVKRHTMQCPICYKLISIDQSYAHLAFHGG